MNPALFRSHHDHRSAVSLCSQYLGLPQRAAADQLGATVRDAELMPGYLQVPLASFAS